MIPEFAILDPLRFPIRGDAAWNKSVFPFVNVEMLRKLLDGYDEGKKMYLLHGFGSGFCFTVPHYFSNFPFVGHPRYFSPVQVLAGEKYQTMNLRREYSWFSETFLFAIFIFQLQAISALNNDNVSKMAPKKT